MADPKAQITIHIHEDTDVQIDFRVKVSTKWIKVVKAYRTKRELDESVDLRFVQRSTGNQLSMDPDTLVSDLGLGDDEDIDVSRPQTGGGFRLARTLSVDLSS